MFLNNLTWSEIQNKVLDDSDFLERNSRRIFNKCFDLMKTQRPLPVYYYKYAKNNNKNEYLFLAWSLDGRDLLTYICAVINSPKGKDFVTLEGDLKDIKEKKESRQYTSHYVRRYRERFLKNDICIEKALAILIENDSRALTIYRSPKDKDKSVIAISDGLALVTKFSERHITRYDTFISDEMLGPTQREAKERIALCLSNNLSESEVLYYTPELEELSPYIQDIYDKYYNDSADYLIFRKSNEDTSLDFKLTTDKSVEDKKLDESKRMKEAKESKLLASSIFGGGISIVSEHINGVHNGKGKMFLDLKDGRGKGVYEGDFVNGKPEGRGKWVFGDYSYEGEWKGGKEHGYGIQIDGADKYIGYFKNGEKTGKGKWMFGNGYIAEGNFVRGLLHGKGKETFPDGRYREGTYFNDKLHGKCSVKYANGDRYVGNCKHGYKDGYGIYTWANGRRYEGEWKNDLKSGKGKFFTMYDVASYTRYYKDELVEKKLLRPYRKLPELLAVLPLMRLEYIKFFYKFDIDCLNKYNADESVSELKRLRPIFYDMCKNINYLSEECDALVANEKGLFRGHGKSEDLFDTINCHLNDISENITWNDFDDMVKDLEDGYDIEESEIDHYIKFQFGLWDEIIDAKNKIEKDMIKR